MATKKTCICIEDLEERRRELDNAIDIVEELQRLRTYWVEETDGKEVACPGYETKIRIYDEIIKYVIENYD